MSEIHLFLAAINTYLKEYLIPVTLSDVSHIRTECCDQPAGLVCLGGQTADREAQAAAPAAFWVTGVRSVFLKHCQCCSVQYLIIFILSRAFVPSLVSQFIKSSPKGLLGGIFLRTSFPFLFPQDKSTLGMDSGRAAKQRGTKTKKEEFRFHLNTWTAKY